MPKEFATSPIAHEEKYIDLDEKTGLWCQFGLESGFAYATFASEEQALRASS